MDRTESRIGRFRLMGHLAQGGMGRLYLAAYEGAAGTSKTVALKCVLPELANQTCFKTMFLDEARVAIQLSHPNIVTTYELGEADGTYFISMEYIPGEDLGHILKHCRHSGVPIPLRVALRIIVACTSALEYAHTLATADGRSLRVVHCDVNPTNVMVSYHGAVKLLDFGIAKFRTSSIAPSPGQFRGKVAYSALEQIDGGPIDARTDLFCLGVVCWEMLTGRRLFDAPNPLAAVELLRSRPVAPPSLFRPEVPPELDSAVLDVLARDPDQRPSSAAAFGQRLEGIRANVGLASEKNLADWLVELFGSERAQNRLKLARHEARMTSEVQTTAQPPTHSAHPAPRVAWSTDAGGGDTIQRPHLSGATQTNVTAPALPSATVDLSDPLPRPLAPDVPIPRRLTYSAVAALVLGVTGLTIFNIWPVAVKYAPPSPPAVLVTSMPEGGTVFIDGEPTGMVTPARITGVLSKTELQLRVDFPDGTSVVRQISVPITGEAHIDVERPAVMGVR